jgi:hypothetical protein
MPKRARAHSESAWQPVKRWLANSNDYPPSVALTKDNLARLQAELTMPLSQRMLSSKRINNLDQCDKLEAYRIYVDMERALPAVLAELLETTVCKPYDPDAVSSPNAKEIV